MTCSSVDQIDENSVMSRCYACDSKATTKEHVPPNSFFPKGHREDLLTVPSCEKHNCDNSDDVEYVRNIITLSIQANDKARELFEKKVLKSLSRNSRLTKETFVDMFDTVVEGQLTGGFTINLEKFDLIFNSIGKALFFKDFNKTHPYPFKVFTESLFFREHIPEEQYKIFNSVSGYISNLGFVEKKTSNPVIFRYSIYNDKFGIAYKLVLYEGFVVYVFSKY